MGRGRNTSLSANRKRRSTTSPTYAVSSHTHRPRSSGFPLQHQSSTGMVPRSDGSSAAGPSDITAMAADFDSLSIPAREHRGAGKSAGVGTGGSSHCGKQTRNTPGKGNGRATRSADDHGRGNGDRAPFICPECLTRCPDESGLQDHFNKFTSECTVKIFDFHDEGLRCPQCKKVIDIKDRYKHVQEEHDWQNGLLHCPWCTYTTATQENLRKHTRDHRKCPLCKKVYPCRSPEDLGNHMTESHLDFVEEVSDFWA